MDKLEGEADLFLSRCPIIDCLLVVYLSSPSVTSRLIFPCAAFRFLCLTMPYVVPARTVSFLSMLPVCGMLYYS